MEKAISEHVIVSWAMTTNSKDECLCGEKINPAPSNYPGEPLQDQRRRGHALHVAAEIRQAWKEDIKL